jgi:hypothetical protein
MTQKEAKELTLELWRYLAEHPECATKKDAPKDIHNKVSGFNYMCPLCQLFRNEEPYCRGCPLRDAGEDCRRSRSAYDKWHTSFWNGGDNRKEAAERIVAIVSAWEPEEV